MIVYRRVSWRLGGILIQQHAKMSNSNAPSTVAAVVQLTCTADKQANLQRASDLIRKAKKEHGASIVFLPEAFDFIGESGAQTKELAEPLDGPTVSKYQQLAKELDLEVSLGGFHEATTGGKLRNTHVYLGRDGSVSSTYSKCHLFDVEIPSKGIRLRESDYIQPGPRITPPVRSSIEGWKIGLGICYDLRFPEMSLTLAARGANVLTYPSAFTVPTGRAHWHTLLRARAIECQSYVIAAAQSGKHNDKRSSYGHSIIIDPWGKVVAEIEEEGEGVASAELDLTKVSKVREEMPVSQHRRHDLYALAARDNQLDPPDEGSMPFGPHTIPGNQVVFASEHTYVTVNRKPVLPYHLLVIPKRRSARRLRDLNAQENADFFNCVSKAQALAELVTGATSSTLSIQDGPDAGQTVDQLHCHVLARKEGDFENNDDIYDKLGSHDHGPNAEMGLRTPEEMEQEASYLRTRFNDVMRNIQQ